ncbi:MAG: carboxymuconolactone decarboxylase family protein [Candidatus Methylomirabilales bacterium]
MARIPYVEKEQAPEEIRQIYENIEKARGMVPNLLKLMAYSPGLLRGFLGLNTALPGAKVDPRLRELAYLKTSQVNGCHY